MGKSKNDKTTMEEDQILCTAIEGGLATSTPDFIQYLMEKYVGKKTVGALSLLKRLRNIKYELEGYSGRIPIGDYVDNEVVSTGSQSKARWLSYDPPVWQELTDKIKELEASTEEVTYISAYDFFCLSRMQTFSICLCKCDGVYSIEITNHTEEDIFKEFEFSGDGYVQAVDFCGDLFAL